MADVEAPPRPDTACPTCGAPAERGQLVCLECGSRIALAYRRPPSWKVPVAISVVLLLAAGAGAVLAYQAIDDEAEREAAATPAKVDEPDTGDASAKPANPAGDARTEVETEASETAQAGAPEPKESADGLVKDGPLYTWPRSLQGFTVVLLSNEDRPSAAAFARSASQTRRERIGVIRSDDFATLPTGFFVVFAGKYDKRPEADRSAARLGEAFPGAFAQAVRRR